MKKTLLFLAGALLSAGSAFAAANADFKVGGISYHKLDGDSVEVTYEGSSQTNKDEYAGDIVIPATVTYSGVTYRVTTIGTGAFYTNKKLTSITIGENVHTIMSNAIYNNTILDSIHFPENGKLKRIEKSAFSTNKNLKELVLPNTVTYIGGSAFASCSSLKSVVLPDKLDTIQNLTFNKCESLKSITIPDGVRVIGEMVFNGCVSLDSITIGKNVQKIDADAFLYNTELVVGGTYNVDSLILSYVNYTGDIASWCGIHFENKYSNPTCWTEQLHINGELVTEINIPEGVKSIGQNAFYLLDNITSVTIPASVDSIGKNAFAILAGLKKCVCLGNPTTSNVGGYLLYNSPLLDTIIAPASFFDYDETVLSNLPKNISYIHVNNGEITDNGFVVINRSANTLGTLDLSGATNTAFAEGAFANCYKLENFAFPKGVTSIGYMAFTNCMNLRSVTVPAAVTEIGARAFENCRSLQKVTFGGSEASETTALTTIGDWAFYCCHELENLTLPEGVTEIGSAAFWGCTYLQELSLPSTLRRAGNNCFALCSKLQKITCLAELPPMIEDKTFFEVSRETPVYVKSYTNRLKYEEDTYWGEFFTFLTLDGTTGVEDITTENTEASKVIENGVMYILRDGEKYTVTGTKVQ